MIKHEFKSRVMVKYAKVDLKKEVEKMGKVFIEVVCLHILKAKKKLKRLFLSKHNQPKLSIQDTTSD